MSCFASRAVATARLTALASKRDPRRSHPRGLGPATHRPARNAVPCVRWVAAPARGDAAKPRGESSANVLYEPSGADLDAEDDVDAVAARDDRTFRQRGASSSSGSESASGPEKKKTGAPSRKRTASANALAREAKVTMSAMRQAEAAKKSARSDAQLRRDDAGPPGDPESASAAASCDDSEPPVSPRPEAKAKAAEGLARLTLGKGTKTSSGTDPKAAFTSKPVDAEAAAAVLGAPPTTSSELPAPTKVKANAGKRLSGEKKTLRPSEASPTKPSKASPTKPRATKKARVPAPTGSGAHKPQWDSFVDWKMMEHQDYADLPDDQFEKLSEKLHIKEKWRPMVSYLVSLGLTTKELEKCLVNCEEIFKRPVAKVMTRVEYLQNELGFEGDELRKLIRKEPAILLQRNRHSIPRCRYLTELGIPSEKLPSMLRKQPQILHLSVQKGLMPRVAYFKKELLIPEAEIPKMLERNPAVLTFSVENQIKPRVDFLKDLGISHDGVVKMIVRHPHLLQYSFEGLEEHINFLTSIGMDEQDVVHTVTRLSQLFSLSVKDSLRPKFKYLTDALGGDHKTCVKFPAYFSLSLDQRIRPRHAYLQSYQCAPDPFPMKYLSENDAAFAARAAEGGGSLRDFEEFKQAMVPRFKLETERAKERANQSTRAQEHRSRMREARAEQQRRLMVQNRTASQRIVDARNSMGRVKLLGQARKSR